MRSGGTNKIQIVKEFYRCNGGFCHIPITKSLATGKLVTILGSTLCLHIRDFFRFQRKQTTKNDPNQQLVRSARTFAIQQFVDIEESKWNIEIRKVFHGRDIRIQNG